MTVCWKVEAHLRWRAVSGPQYDTIDFKLASMDEERAFGFNGKDRWILTSREMSFASWHALDQAKPGDIASIKVRIDQVAGL